MASDNQDDNLKKTSQKPAEAKTASNSKPNQGTGKTAGQGQNTRTTKPASAKSTAKKPVTIDLAAEKVDVKKTSAEKKPSSEMPKKTAVPNTEKAAANKMADNKKETPKPAQKDDLKGKKKTGGFALLTSAILGGLIGSGLIYGGVHYGFLPTEDKQNDLTILQERLLMLEAKNEELASALKGSSLNGNANFEELEKRLAALENSDFVLSSDLEKIQNNTSGVIFPPDILNRVTAFETRLVALEETASAIDNGTAPSSNSSIVNEKFAAKITALEEKVEGLQIPEISEADITVLQQSLDLLKQDYQALTAKFGEDRAETQKVLDDVLTFGDRINLLEGRLQKDVLSGETILSIAHQTAALNLRSQVLSGKSFEGAFGSVEKIGLQKETLAKLEPFKTVGLPSKDNLKSSLKTLIAKAQIGSADGTKQQGELSAFDKLLRNARSAINVRDLSDKSPENVAFIKLEKAFETSDSKLFSEGFEALSDPQKALFSDWKPAFEAHLALDDLLNEPSSQQVAD